MSCGVCGREFCDSQADVDSLVDCQRLGVARLRSALAAAEQKAELWAQREGALVERGIRTDADQLSQLQAAEHQIALAESAFTGAEEEIERLKAENASLRSMSTALGKQCAELERDRDYNAALRDDAVRMADAAEAENASLRGSLREARTAPPLRPAIRQADLPPPGQVRGATSAQGLRRMQEGSMTPAERASIVLRDIMIAEIHGDNMEPIIAEAIRAALRERDAAWTKAVMAHAEKGGEELWCLLTPACDKRLFDCDCEGGAPLRALLEEAGK